MSEAYSEEAFVNAVRDQQPCGTSDVAEQVGCSRPTAENYLKRLAATGRVEQTKISHVLVWTLPEGETE